MNIKQKISGIVFYVLFAIWYFFSSEFDDNLSAFGCIYYKFIKHSDTVSNVSAVFSILISVVFLTSLIIYICCYKVNDIKYKRANFIFNMLMLTTFLIKFFLQILMFSLDFILQPLYNLFNLPVIVSMIVLAVINYKDLKNEHGIDIYIKQKIGGFVFYAFFVFWYTLGYEFSSGSSDGAAAINYLSYRFFKEADAYSKLDLIFCIIISIMALISLTIYILGFKLKNHKYKQTALIFNIVFTLTFLIKPFVTSQRLNFSFIDNILRPINEYNFYNLPIIISMIVVTVLSYKALKTEN